MALLRSYAVRRLRLALRSPPQHYSLIQNTRICSQARGPCDAAFISHVGCRGLAICTSPTNGVVLHGFGSSNSSQKNGTKGPSMLELTRLMSAQAKAAPNQIRQAALRVTLLSPGFVYEPYKPREPIPFWQRKGVCCSVAIQGSRRQGLYQTINMLLANGDKASLRKLVTENMFSNFKNEIKRRDSIWNSVYWELVEPVVSIRTLRARLIGIDKNDLDKAFIQLTLEFLTKQKFEAYDKDGAVVTGDKAKEVLVRDIWVFERSLFHRGSYWRLCARLSP